MYCVPMAQRAPGYKIFSKCIKNPLLFHASRYAHFLPFSLPVLPTVLSMSIKFSVWNSFFLHKQWLKQYLLPGEELFSIIIEKPLPLAPLDSLILDILRGKQHSNFTTAMVNNILIGHSSALQTQLLRFMYDKDNEVHVAIAALLL